MSETQKQTSLFVKGATLTSFVVLMAAFVAYRAGAFDGKEAALPAPYKYEAPAPVVTQASVSNTSLNTTALSQNTTSTSVLAGGRKLTDQEIMMFSSKTMILTEGFPQLVFPQAKNIPEQQRILMSGSKSTMVMEPPALPWWEQMEMHGTAHVAKAAQAQEATFIQGRK